MQNGTVSQRPDDILKASVHVILCCTLSGQARGVNLYFFSIFLHLQVKFINPVIERRSKLQRQRRIFPKEKGTPLPSCFTGPLSQITAGGISPRPSVLAFPRDHFIVVSL